MNLTFKRCVLALTMFGCSTSATDAQGPSSVQDAGGVVDAGSEIDSGVHQTSLALSKLGTWVRHPKNPIFGGSTGQVAADPYVWEEAPGHYRMVYTDTHDVGPADYQALAMATSTNLVDWKAAANTQFPSGLILQGAGPSGQDLHLETPIYRRTKDGKHQVFYIGYEVEAVCHAAIYKAEADQVDGPYVREATPVVSWTIGGDDEAAMTSPTIVEHEGMLYMTYIGWKGFPDGPVTIIGATSTTDGRTWEKKGTLPWDDIFGVEAHTEKGPDGFFYRVGMVGEVPDQDQFAIGRSLHPFGPYEKLPNPILVEGGPTVKEGDSIVSPSLLFPSGSTTAYIFYAAVDTGGFPWVTSLATCDYGAR